MKKAFFVFFTLFIPVLCVFCVEIAVPHLEAATRGAMEDGDFRLSTSIEADIGLNGGYKYGILLGLGAEIQNLEKALSYGRMEMPYAKGTANPGSPDTGEYDAMVDEVNDRYNNQASLSIRSLSATVRELFGTPLEMSFFIGAYDKLGSGDEFQDYFGTTEVGTGLRGFFYFPNGLGNDPSLRFNGAIHSITGTGVSLRAPMEKLIPSFYLYQDLSFKDKTGAYMPGHYSADFRLLANSEDAKFEGFAGITYINEDDPVIRAGLLAYFISGPVEILLQAGIPYWKAGGNFTIDNCYLLVEPRLRFTRLGLDLTFFYHPVYYMNREIMDSTGQDAERGKADINLKIYGGSISRTGWEGGLETTVSLQIHNGEDLRFWVSPFIRAVSSGLLWDFKIRLNPLYFSGDGELAEGYIGIKAAF